MPPVVAELAERERTEDSRPLHHDDQLTRLEGTEDFLAGARPVDAQALDLRSLAQADVHDPLVLGRIARACQELDRCALAFSEVQEQLGAYRVPVRAAPDQQKAKRVARGTLVPKKVRAITGVREKEIQIAVAFEVCRGKTPPSFPAQRMFLQAPRGGAALRDRSPVRTE